MAPTILIAGATGNTGRRLTEILPGLLKASNDLSGHRIIALTRSLTSPAAQELAKLPGVEVIEKNWVEITSDWLRDQRVVRAFIASHNEPNQFAEESTFYSAALGAGVEYIVRISTTAANVRPDFKAYYPRTHWAIENLLSQPEFAALKWTSLQPNVFGSFWLASSAELIKEYRKTGKQSALRLLAAKDAPVGIIDSAEVGVFAAHLLAQSDPTIHNKAKYVLNGPVDITGKQVVELVEQYIGTKVDEVIYQDTSFIDMMYEAKFAPLGQSKNVILSIKHAMETGWEGKCSVSTTSAEVLQLAAPKRTPADMLKELLDLE
ncbi:hypothetical protein N7452_006243 [Penicillium brevicompactum]|uniref:NmrA-like domain-containing protein n=1 Tax=Penicillium brevicompactum TaxID=5074 RepID=A0A9W9UHB1_PENBR|nr:hypothetical protein N7452_006243 [Penicillium brevicompactum]